MKSFFRLFTFAPLAMLVIGALLTGKGLVSMWGMPMFTTVGLWVVSEIGVDWNQTMIKRLATGAVMFVSLAAAVFVGEAVWSKSHKPQRTSLADAGACGKSKFNLERGSRCSAANHRRNDVACRPSIARPAAEA
ncbi:apolipoprotein N-acyltransferase [Rhizobium sp. BK491]|nr:apolipoprotein N-acyltransferase [Rhizobium sp. BK491]